MNGTYVRSVADATNCGPADNGSADDGSADYGQADYEPADYELADCGSADCGSAGRGLADCSLLAVARFDAAASDAARSGAAASGAAASDFGSVARTGSSYGAPPHWSLEFARLESLSEREDWAPASAPTALVANEIATFPGARAGGLRAPVAAHVSAAVQASAAAVASAAVHVPAAAHVPAALRCESPRPLLRDNPCGETPPADALVAEESGVLSTIALRGWSRGRLQRHRWRPLRRWPVAKGRSGLQGGVVRSREGLFGLLVGGDVGVCGGRSVAIGGGALGVGWAAWHSASFHGDSRPLMGN